MKTNFTHSGNAQRGSLLIVALIFSAIIGISLATYLQLTRTVLNLSNRSLYNNAAMNMAEQGLEEAIYATNQKVLNPTTYTWPGWTLSGGNAQQKWTDTSLSQNTSIEYRAYVLGYSSSAPVIMSRATVTLGNTNGKVLEKWVRVTLAGSSRFSNGMVAVNSILFKGNNATVDSFNSLRNNDGTLRASPVTYSAGVRRDKGSVASISVASGSILVKQADVWGYVKTNGSDPTSAVGSNGSILGSDSVYDSTTWTNSNVDPDRVSTSFSFTMSPDSQPSSSGSIGAINSNASITLGAVGVTQTIVASYLSLSGNNNVVTILGNVTLVLTAPAGTSAIGITGNNSGITISADSSLKIYTAGDITLTGQGVTNLTGQAKNFSISGTSTSSTPQDIKISGGGNFVGTIYAPDASVTINGDGDMSGAVVAKDITLTGNANFHYDEALAEPDGTAPYRVAKWEELTSATSRSAVASYLNF